MLPGLNFSSPVVLRIAAGYLLVAGTIKVVWPLLRLGPDHPEFQAQSLAHKIRAYTREFTISVAYLVAGLALLSHHAWGRTVALVFLVIGGFYGANAFAWGFSQGPPTPRARLFSRIVVGIWHGLWFYVIYRLPS